MAYGAAGSLDEIEPYLKDIRGGRPVSPELAEQVKERYRLMGGKSPLLEITKQQAAALKEKLNQNKGLNIKKGGSEASRETEVYFGMRHWHPYIKDTVGRMKADGVREITAVCLTPYHSKMSVGAYFQKLDEAIASAGTSFEVRRVESWNDRPELIEAIAEKVLTALNRFSPEVRPKVILLFSAHSLPERILADKDPYPDELNETIELVMKRIGPRPWHFAYQSKGRTPEPWLGPDVAEVIEELYAQGCRHLLMAPIGFISDHMETLYDVDVMYRQQCDAKGIQLERAESLNASPGLIDALAAVVLENS